MATPSSKTYLQGTNYSPNRYYHERVTLVLRELLVGGRLARGELHQYECYRARFEVSNASGRYVLAERAHLEPTQFSPATLGVQGMYPVLGSLYILTLGTDTEAARTRAWPALRAHGDVLAGVGALPNGCGILVRALGSTAALVRAALDDVLALLVGQPQQSM